MSTKNGRILKGTLLGAAGGLAFILTAIAFLPTASKPLAMPAESPAPSLSVFCGPSHVPEGEHWVILGSFEDLPADLVVTPAAAGVQVLETLKLSKSAIGVRLSAALGVQGNLLRVSSATLRSEASPNLYQGVTPESRTADANFREQDFVDGSLVVDGKHFIYGYYPAGGSPLASLWIHNRSTGEWHRHEPAAERALEARDQKIPDPPSFVEVNPLDTLPDTDGNGTPDFADVAESKPPVPDHLGVELVPQTNVLDLVAVDEAGLASWRTVNVFTTYVPTE